MVFIVSLNETFTIDGDDPRPPSIAAYYTNATDESGRMKSFPTRHSFCTSDAFAVSLVQLSGNEIQKRRVTTVLVTSALNTLV